MNKKKFLAVSLSFLFVLSFLPFNGACADAVLINPGFEQAGLTQTKAYGWHDFHNGYSRVKDYGVENWTIMLDASDASALYGASQRIDLAQETQKPVYIGARVRGSNIGLNANGYFGASIYAEIHLKSGAVAYWNSIPNTGTFSWREIGFNTASLPAVNEPIDHIFVIPILGHATGIAFFDDIIVQEYIPQAGAVTLMFDDGESSTYDIALPELSGYNMLASAAVFTDVVGTESYMDWTEVVGLQQAGWEIVSHSKTHSDLTLLSKKQMIRELVNSKRILEGKGLTINNFAYPFGAFNATVQANAAKYYRSARAYEHGDNPYGADPFRVKVRSVVADTSIEEIQSWLSSALNDSRWQVIVFHSIQESGYDEYYVTPEKFSQIMNEINNSGVETLTYNQGLDRFAK